MDYAVGIHKKPEERVGGRFRSKHAHGQKERSKNPTVVMTASGEVATAYVRELDLLVTVVLPENTPTVLSLGKLFEEFRTSGQKPHLIK